IKAVATVRFTAVDDANTLTFELNNALNLDRVTGEDGRDIRASRSAQDMSVRLSLPQSLQKGKAATLTFNYDGRLSGEEESPVFGIRFASIRPDTSYLMYPARWFPVNDYSVDRFAADIRVTVPQGYRAVGSGIDTTEAAAGGGTVYRFKFDNPSFPGS